MSKELVSKEPKMYYGDYFNSDKWARRRYEITYSMLKPYLKKGATVLDVGCYKADFLDLVKEPVVYTGVDFDKEALKIAASKGAKTLQVNIEREEIPLKEQYDIVLATELLEHLKDPELVLAQLAKLTKKKGVALISLPNECNIYNRFMVLIGKGIDSSNFDPYYHLHFPTITQSRDFVSKYFDVIEEKYNTSAVFGGKLAFLAKVIPLSVLEKLSYISPGLFARGAIFLCKVK